MKVSRRVQRAERELLQIIATYIHNGLKDPLLGIVSVSRVEASPDLRSAKVYLSMRATEEEKEENIEILEMRRGEIQHQVGRQLPMKFTPKLKFQVDRGMEKAERVHELLSQVIPRHEEEEE